MAPETPTGTLASQAIDIPGVSNARDLGGYVGLDGAHVRRGLLLRTAALSTATPEALATLVDEYRLALVVDFRTDAEAASAPDPDMPGVRLVRLRVIDEQALGALSQTITGVDFSNPEASLRSLMSLIQRGVIGDDLYVRMLDSERAHAAYREFFDLVCDTREGSVLFHCTGGKDRTGLAAAFLLSVLGVSRSDIMSDYRLTNEATAERIEQVVDYARTLVDDASAAEGLRRIVGVDPACLERVLDMAQDGYGSVVGYLQRVIGVTDKQLEIVRSRYLE